MGSQRQNHQLEVGEDVKFQNRWWVFERIAWVFMALLLLAALLGLLGPGLLSLDQVEHAVLERSGSIAIIPKEKDDIGETTRL